MGQRKMYLQVQTYKMHALKFSDDLEIVGPVDIHHVPLTGQHGRQTCRHCQKLNHLAKWCLLQFKHLHNKTATTPAFIHSINTNLAGFSTCVVNIVDSCIPGLLDKGAKVSLLIVATYEHSLAHLPL